MAYEGIRQVSPDGFSRLKVPQKWLWAWDGLAFCMPMWEANAVPVDLLRGLTPTLNGPPTAPLASFQAFEQTLYANSYYSFGDDNSLSFLGDVTIACMHSPIGTDQSCMWAYADSISVGLPFALIFSFQSSAKYSFWNDNSGVRVNTTGTYGTDTRNFVIGRRFGLNTASPTLDIAVNGASYDQLTSAACDYGTPGGGTELCINRVGGYDGYKGGGVFGPLYLWNRTLSDIEVSDLFSDPYGPIRQVSQEYSFFDYVTSSGATATPAAGSLSITGLAPTTFGSANADIASPGALALSGLAPSATSGVVLTPGASSLALSGSAPSLISDHVLTADTTSSLALTGAAPTVFGDANAAPNPQAVAISGLAPSVSSDQMLSPDSMALVLTLMAPTVTSSPDALTPASQSVAISGQVPTVTVIPDPPVYVGVGTVAVGDHVAVLSPGEPASVATGDLLITVAFLRNAGTLSINSGWTQHSLVDTTQNGIGYYLQTWYRFATGSGDAATVTPSGGSTSPQSMTCAFTLAFNNVHATTPFGVDGSDSFNTSSANVGPISAATAVEQVGAVIVFGVRTGTAGSAIATLSGDSLTWVEAVEQFNTVNSLGISVACDYAIWSGGVPTLTSKTFTITGGSSAPGFGKMFLLNAPSAQGADVDAHPGAGSVAITGRVPVINAGATAAAGAQSVVLTGQAPTVVADANVEPSAGSIALSGLAPALVSDEIIAAGAGSLSITGYAPATANDIEATPDSQAVVITGYVPDVSADHVLEAGATALSIAGLAPTLLISSIVVPDAQALSITGYQASAEFVEVTPGAGSLTLEGAAPAIVADAIVYPGTGSLVLGYPGGVLRSPGIPMQYVNTPDSTPSTPRFVWSH